MITITCDECHKLISDVDLLKVSTSVRYTRINDPGEETLHFHKKCWQRVKQYIATGA